MNPKLAKIVGAKNAHAVPSSSNREHSAGTFKWSNPKMWWTLSKDTFQKWSADKAPRLGASLSYYTVFSLVPLLVLTIAIAGLVFGKEAAQAAMMAQIESLVGPQSAAAIQQMLQVAQKPSSGIFASVIAIGTLLLGASGVFAQLQDALNTVWGVEPKTGRGIWGAIKDRFFSFVAVLGTGFLLLVSLVLSAALAAFGKLFLGWLPGQEAVLHLANFTISFGV
ncbi:MAG TPA: YhjD/YihY/BrkB family envelope integrity protein, partial [Nitrospiraceae bacterium]|nr:YhjD/YihY/BrkB family envelope integrity protein [Nitrospiraceae bacterium]